MTRNRRTRILIQGDGVLRNRMAALVRERCVTELLDGPVWGLVMLSVRETARNSLFHPGEVLVSEAKVMVDGAIGLGIIAGDQPVAAEELALIDGAWNSSGIFVADWIPLLMAEESRIREEHALAQAAVLRTKVDFQTMDTEALL